MITVDAAVPLHPSSLMDPTARDVTQTVVLAKAAGLVDTRRGTGSFTALSTVGAAFPMPQKGTLQISRPSGKATLRDILRYHMDMVDDVMRSR